MKKISTVAALIISISLFSACAPSPEPVTSTKPKKNAPVDGDQTVKPDPIDPNTNPVDPTVPGTVEEPPVVKPPVDPVIPDPVIKDPDTMDPTAPKVNLAGGIDPLNAFVRTGEITGWAVDKDNLMSFLTVNIYFEGDNTKGKKVGSTKANLIGSDENNGGEHAFILRVPAEFIDNLPHKVYGYAVVNGKEGPLSTKMPYTMTFFKPKGGAAKTLYTSIQFESKCSSCHRNAWSYENRWEKLVQPGSDGSSWGPEANYLYEKISQNHRAISGGKPCNVVDCNKVKEWFRLEFGEVTKN